MSSCDNVMKLVFFEKISVRLRPVICALVSLSMQRTPPSGLCFAGVLINFRSGKFQALDMSFFSKGHAVFFREFWHDLC